MKESNKNFLSCFRIRVHDCSYRFHLFQKLQLLNCAFDFLLFRLSAGEMFRATAGVCARVNRTCPLKIAGTVKIVSIGNGPVSFSSLCVRQRSRLHYTFGSLRSFSSSSPRRETQNPLRETPEGQLTAIYNGPLAKQLKIVKLFSLSTSAMGLALQPVLFSHLVAYSGVAKVMTAMFCGIFIFITPVFLHMLCKRWKVMKGVTK